MNRYVFLALAVGISQHAGAQSVKKDKGAFREYKPGYYQNVILKSLDSARTATNPAEKSRGFKMDFSNYEYPSNPEQYTQVWHNTPISQGSTGTCWCFSTTSFYESEIFRITGQKIKLSEMFPVYWQYVERAKYFVANRGKMEFGEGSETNGLTEMYKKYGAVPAEAYTGRKPTEPYFNHNALVAELSGYLKSVKDRNAWNEEEVLATTKSILNFYMGEPPVTITVAGKSMTPLVWLEKNLRLKMDDYVNFMSLKQEPFYQMAEYKVGDNWWHSKNYNNVPSEDFVGAIKMAIKGGYSISLGGDVSEAGMDGSKNIAVVPTFDIPSEYIDDDARQFRFSNGSSTDDHAMHLVGYIEKDGKTWFLVKDSGAGSRNCGESCKSFGYFYMHEDFIKLKMMTVTVNKDAVKEILKKMKNL